MRPQDMPKWYCSDFGQILIGLSLKDNVKRATSGFRCQLPIIYLLNFHLFYFFYISKLICVNCQLIINWFPCWPNLSSHIVMLYILHNIITVFLRQQFCHHWATSRKHQRFFWLFAKSRVKVYKSVFLLSFLIKFVTNTVFSPVILTTMFLVIFNNPSTVLLSVLCTLVMHYYNTVFH